MNWNGLIKLGIIVGENIMEKQKVDNERLRQQNEKIARERAAQEASAARRRPAPLRASSRARDSKRRSPERALQSSAPTADSRATASDVLQRVSALSAALPSESAARVRHTS